MYLHMQDPHQCDDNDAETKSILVTNARGIDIPFRFKFSSNSSKRSDTCFYKISK